MRPNRPAFILAARYVGRFGVFGVTLVPMKLVPGIAAVLFAFLGFATLLGAGASFGV